MIRLPAEKEYNLGHQSQLDPIVRTRRSMIPVGSLLSLTSLSPRLIR